MDRRWGVEEMDQAIYLPNANSHFLVGWVEGGMGGISPSPRSEQFSPPLSPYQTPL